MNDREYRDLQLTAPHLILIIVGLLAVLVVVFILGFSLGKKQAAPIAAQIPPTVEKVESRPLEVNLPEDRTAAGPESRTADSTPPPESTAPPKSQPAAAEPVPAPAEKTAAGQQKNLYYIQVGAYSKKDGAITLASTFQKNGYPTVILDPFPTDRRAIFRVRVGGYQTREEAQRVMQALLRLTGKSSSDYFVQFVK